MLGGRGALSRAAGSLWSALGVESLGQRWYRRDCKDDKPAEPLYRRRWLIHALTIWGFLGLLAATLLAATLLDWGLALTGVKATGTAIPLVVPHPPDRDGSRNRPGVRREHVHAHRVRKVNRAAKVSTTSDRLLLVLLWITGASGFFIEAALSPPSAPR
jgi:hypothetical protein